MLNMLKKKIKSILPYGFVRYIVLKKEMEAILASRPSPRWLKPVRHHDECIVLAGGPSTNAIWDDLVGYAAKADVYTLNNSLKNEKVRALRPVGHVMIDPAYFDPARDPNLPGVESFIEVAREMLAQVDWPMTLYVFSHQYDAALCVGYGENQWITIRIVPSLPPSEKLDENQQFVMMDEGIFGVGGMNVPVVVLYAAVVARYRKVWLAGVDADYVKTFEIDEHNRLVNNYGHFYEDKVARFVNPLPAGKELRNLSDSLYEYYFVRRYAESRNVPIVNLSLASLCDAFPKGRLGQEPYEDLRPEERKLYSER